MRKSYVLGRSEAEEACTMADVVTATWNDGVASELPPLGGFIVLTSLTVLQEVC